MRRFTIFAALAAAVALSGCEEDQRERASDAAAAVRSAIESVENAPKVAERQDGWPAIRFDDGGSATVTEFRAQESGYRYTLEIAAETWAACYGALSRAYPRAETVSLNGAAQDPLKLLPRGTARDRVDPSAVLCSSASLPAKIVAIRETDGKGPVQEVFGGYVTYRSAE